MRIEIDDLTRPQVHDLLREHLANMYEVTPADKVYALDLQKLRGAGHHLLDGVGGGRGARLRRAQGTHARPRRGQVHAHAAVRPPPRRRTRAAFTPAIRLYETAGFRRCGPFADDPDDPHSVFLSLPLERIAGLVRC